MCIQKMQIDLIDELYIAIWFAKNVCQSVGFWSGGLWEEVLEGI